jgi:hypothetical protein
LRIRRLIAWRFAWAMIAGSSGCSLAPKTFRSIHHPAPLVRARSVGLSERLPEGQAVPALVARLDDTDPVVRLAAHEELKRRTGQDFGYVPWDDPQPRAKAVSRWRSWLSERYGSGRKLTRRGPRLASPQSPPVATRVTLPSPPALPSEQQ